MTKFSVEFGDGMFGVEACAVPENALLSQYDREQSNQWPGAFVDCYTVDTEGDVLLAELVFEFYTTPVFKLERLILKHAVGRPSTDEDARQLALGSANTFSAWRVEDRTDNELLMCDFRGRTRSWFAVSPKMNGASCGTQLQFGSAVVPKQDAESAGTELGWEFRFLLNFHKLYSQILLSSARARLQRQKS